MPLFAEASAPPPTGEEELFPHDGYGCDAADDNDALSGVVLLNEEGFPLELAGEDDAQNGAERSDNTPGKSEFAEDFYLCGTDWSCLLPEDCNGSVDLKRKDVAHDSTIPSGKKLKQASLFQIWGFKKNSDEDSFSVSSVDHKQDQWGNFDGGDESGILSGKKNVKAEIWGSISRDVPTHSAKSKPFRKRMNTRDVSRRSPACPFYKKIPGTTFSVDAFRYGCIEGCSAYFLSHFHSDHYGGLSKKWSHGPIYCTPLTARLIQMCLSVNPLYICPLELNTKHVIEGVTVTLLEANHCPGAALIHLYLPNGQCYLHTGDFRASKQMQDYPLLANLHVNVLYLDTTYCNPKFPPQETVLNYVVKITKNQLKNQPRTLVVVGAYSIGKECVYRAISKALKAKIYANASRRRILQAYGWSELSDSLCANGKNTFLHVLPMASLRFERLKDYLKTYENQFTAVLAFRPTGWTFSEKIGNHLEQIKPISKGNVTIYGVPYSEHSSFTELWEFVQYLKPDKIIPTVNVWNQANREKMQSYFRDWLRG
ncbi:DNA cross-link repair protein SNM1 isoform X2 [Neltuma alba]|uniref:DNA cross-link repair protein SNM1 isoform X2 n=1 Tax=Neltuma alba TaxID=207710 RepID=UPI0010A41220|nr:DNA cross-link repair protein SNM1 isoform X2 [Prosopis alba]